MSQRFGYTEKSTPFSEDCNSLEEMEEEISVTLFRELCQTWLEANGLKIVLEEVNSKPRPKYRRQNAKSNVMDEQ